MKKTGAKFMVVLIGLVIIFKQQLTSIVNSIFKKNLEFTLAIKFFKQFLLFFQQMLTEVYIR